MMLLNKLLKEKNMADQVQIYAPQPLREQPVYTSPPKRLRRKDKPLPSEKRIIFEGRPPLTYEPLYLIVGRNRLRPEGGTGGNNNAGAGTGDTASTASIHKRFTVSPKKPSYVTPTTLLGLTFIALLCLALYAKRRFFPRLDGRVKNL